MTAKINPMPADAKVDQPTIERASLSVPTPNQFASPNASAHAVVVTDIRSMIRVRSARQLTKGVIARSVAVGVSAHLKKLTPSHTISPLASAPNRVGPAFPL